MYVYEYIYIYILRGPDAPQDRAHLGAGEGAAPRRRYSGGRLCTLIGVPCRLSMLSTFSTFANVLF